MNHLINLIPHKLSKLTPLQSCYRTITTKRTYKRHPFDTFAMVKKLQQDAFTRSQSKIIMQILYSMMQTRYSEFRKQSLNKEDLQKHEYLFRAALNELRTELQIMRTKDYTQTQQELSKISRDLDALAHYKREAINQLKVDLQLDLSSHNHEMGAIYKEVDYKMHEINNKFGIQVSEIRSEIEAMKWESIRKAIVMVGGAAAVMTLISLIFKLKEYEKEIGEYNNKSFSEDKQEDDNILLG
ncbi:hypothetical protein K502DRAFT_320853 [Neoconidiobolus thromboides FSU 785]|nr:hypothetical protein K502DRAFT_320853 [Neoconidiobolus thromboides FSU 785]